MIMYQYKITMADVKIVKSSKPIVENIFGPEVPKDEPPYTNETGLKYAC